MKRCIKIGILTFHRSINNGAFMQCYSLSKTIKKDFPDADVEVFDFDYSVVEKSYLPSLKRYLFADLKSFKSFVARCLYLIKNPFHLKRQRKKFRVFRESLSSLPLSATKIIDDEAKACDYIDTHYDILILGSDAIWNFVSRGYPNIYLPDNLHCKLFSYAASCYGMEYESFLKSYLFDVKKRLDGFAFIGVRDKATEDFVHYFSKAKPCFHTCDPTCLLDVDDLPVDKILIETKLKAKGFDFNKKTIGVMGTKKMLDMVRRMFGKDYQIVSLFNYVSGADVQLYDLSPFEWAFVFRYFSLTFTTYFHGTYLSLKNGVPVICVALDTNFSKTHIPKTKDLLMRLGFDDWYFSTDYKNLNYEEMLQKASFLLVANQKELILNRLELEKETYSIFKDCLSKTLKEF